MFILTCFMFEIILDLLIFILKKIKSPPKTVFAALGVGGAQNVIGYRFFLRLPLVGKRTIIIIFFCVGLQPYYNYTFI